MNWTAHTTLHWRWQLPALPIDRRLKHLLLASALAHLSLLLILSKPASPVSLLNETPPTLTVDWQHSTGDVPVQTAMRTRGSAQVQANNRNGTPDPGIPDGTAPSSADSFPTPPALGPGLVESARTLVRESIRSESTEERRRKALAVPAENLGLNSSVNSHASTQNPSVSSETRFADGRIRVVDRWGRVSCYKEPPEYAYTTGGAMPRLAVSTNCP